MDFETLAIQSVPIGIALTERRVIRACNPAFADVIATKSPLQESATGGSVFAGGRSGRCDFVCKMRVKKSGQYLAPTASAVMW